MGYAGRNKRTAAAAALGVLTVLLATGCSFSLGEVEKKNEPTAGQETAAVEEDPAEKEPTAEEKPVGEDPAPEPGNTGVSEDGAVHKARVAQTISDKLAADTDKRPDRVTCPEHLPARVGATIRCRLTAGSDTLGVTVTAISVNGNQVNYSLKADDNVE
ncbi:DUF4333 domain-containing protein [Streptomyces sp. NPDC060366]|uniref:DUF4333 domain-containing protein n=1 Tax=Streptomyces sp. NPDC060366 TaxID=3347105 RepID=UPI00364A94B1